MGCVSDSRVGLILEWLDGAFRGIRVFIVIKTYDDLVYFSL